MIGGAAILLVGAFVLLIHHDQAQPLDRREEGGTRAKHHIHLTRADASPFIQPLGVAESAMQQRDPARETPGVAFQRLWCQRDFGNEHDATLSPRQRRGQRLQVDFGLAAAGDAMQQKHLAGSRLARCGDGGQRARLGGCQREWRRLSDGAARQWIVPYRRLDNGDQPGSL